ncbi:variable surface protein [Plasmodium gonderi]|uniref:Variable surface protein n=1 Tax=Plasmodium gonderi TaxID=77519 RepID=A0A1Y1JF81_PLAGO|nr:variable surface protein [Plasmodium gonderi]GAW79402.1 variable surface protein [Plasmodium gonderi]
MITMSSASFSDIYFRYEDYMLYKDIMDTRSSKGSVNTDDIDKFLQIQKNMGVMKATIEAYCMKIKAYFEYINTNYSSNSNKYCNYVKYWIKKQDDEALNIGVLPISTYLKDYVNEYSSLAKEMGCTLDIGDTSNNIHEKKVKLYNIYDYYSSLVLLITSSISEGLCVYVQNIINLYNDLLSIIIETPDEPLLIELNKIRCLIEKNKLKSKVKCSRELPELSDYGNHQDYKERCKELIQSERIQDQTIHAKGNSVDSFSAFNTSKKVIIITILITTIIGAMFLYLYKFKESWKNLRLRIQRMIRKTININDERCEYIICKSENHIADAEEKNYNIIYFSGK